MLQRPIAYSGDNPYIFVSYAHADNERVWPIIQTLQNRGFRVWYDNGIDPGTEWDKIIAEHLVQCTLFLVVMSNNYLASNNCKDELSYSRDLNKNRVIVHLEEVSLPPELAMRIGRSQALFLYMYNESNIEDFYANLQKASGMMSCYEAPNIVSEQLYAAPQQMVQTQYPPQAPHGAQSYNAQRFANALPQQPAPQPAPEPAPYMEKPVYGKGLPGFRSKTVWKMIVASLGYTMLIPWYFAVRGMFSKVRYEACRTVFPVFSCIYVLGIIFIAVDFLNINEIFTFATKSKRGRASAKILQIVAWTGIYALSFFLLLLIAAANTPRE